MSFTFSQSLHGDLCISIELDTACFVTEFAEKHKSVSAGYKLNNNSNILPFQLKWLTMMAYIAVLKLLPMPFKKKFLEYRIHQSILRLTCDRMFNNVKFDLEDVSLTLSAASLGTEIDHFPEHLLKYAAKLLSFHLLKL